MLQGSSAVRGEVDQLEGWAAGASLPSGRSDGKSCTGKGRTSCLSADGGLNYATILEPLNLLWADLPAGAGSALGRGMEGGRTGLIFLAKETGLWREALRNAPWRERKGCQKHVPSSWDSSLGPRQYVLSWH